MNARRIGVGALFAITAAAMAVSPALASSTTVNANADIYAAGGNQSASSVGGTAPGGFSVAGGDVITFSSVMGSVAQGANTFGFSGPCTFAEGCITLDDGTGSVYNDPDGGGSAASTSTNSGAGGISGILSAPNDGFLAGVFVGSSGPSVVAPSGLNFTTSGTSFTSLSPELDQAFFIGDGLTDDDTSSIQDFIAPAGAAFLYLGISDACGYNGAPSCYGDNDGTYSVNYQIAPSSTSSVPEPSSLPMLLAGLGLIGGSVYFGRKKQVSDKA